MLPKLPDDLVKDAIWRWLEPRLTRHEGAVRKSSGNLGRALMKLLSGRRNPAKEEVDYVRAEEALMIRAMEKIYAKLELVDQTAKSVLRRELEPIISRAARQRAFEQLRSRYASIAFTTDAYRQAIAVQLDRIADEHPRIMRAVERLPVAIGLKQMASLFGDISLERSQLLARVIRDCVLDQHLGRVEQLAAITESEDYRKAMLVAGDLSSEVYSKTYSPPSLASFPGSSIRSAI